MGRKNKAEFPMNPALNEFQYEVAAELGITGLGQGKQNPTPQNQQTLKK